MASCKGLNAADEHDGWGGASDTDAVCRASALLSELGRRQEVPPFVISLSPRGSDAAVQSPAVLWVPWKPNTDQIQWEMLAET